MKRDLFLSVIAAVALAGFSEQSLVYAARAPSEEAPSDAVNDAADDASTEVFARVNVDAPKELLLGKIQHANVAITVPKGAQVLEVSARSEGVGLGLPLARKWRFVDLKSGNAATFKVPYQLTRKFQKGALHFDIKTVGFKAVGTKDVGMDSKKRAPAQHQTATLRLSR